MFYYDPVAKVYSGAAPVVQSAKKVKKPVARVSVPRASKVPAGKAAEPFVKNGVKVEYDKAKGLFSFYDARTGKKLSTKGLDVVMTPTGVSLRKKATKRFVSISELLKNPKATKTAKGTVKKAAKKGATKTASTVAELIPFGKSKKFKIKQLKNGQYRITGLKGNTLPINRELIIKKTKKGFSIIDKATNKRVSVKSILAKLKGNSKNGVKDAAKKAVPTGFFGKIAAAAKANPVAAAVLGLIGIGMATYAISNSGTKRINYEV